MERQRTGRRVSFNTAAQLISQLASQAIALVISIKVARYLGVTRYGIYTFVFSFTTLFSFAVDWGLSFSLLRRMSSDRKGIPGLYPDALALKALMGGLAITVFAVSARFSGVTGEMYNALFIGFALLAVTGIQAMAYMVFQAVERLDIQALLHAAGRAAVLLIIVTVVLPRDMGLTGVLAAPLVTGTVLLVIAAAAVPAVTGNALSSFRITPGQWPSLIRSALPFAFIGILNQLYLHIDVTMLKVLRGSYDVGVYAVPARVVSIGLLAPAAFVSALFPRLNRDSDRGRIRYLTGTAFKYLLAAGFAAGILLLQWGGPLITRFYGAAFLPAIPVLNIIAWALVLMFGNWILGHALYALHKEKQMMAVVGGTVAVNVILNFMLIPSHGPAGAAVATVASEVVIMAAEIILLSRYTGNIFSGHRTGAVVLCAGAGLGTAAALGAVLPPVYSGIAGCGVYLLALGLSKTVSLKEMKRLDREDTSAV